MPFCVISRTYKLTYILYTTLLFQLQTGNVQRTTPKKETNSGKDELGSHGIDVSKTFIFNGIFRLPLVLL